MHERVLPLSTLALEGGTRAARSHAAPTPLYISRGNLGRAAPAMRHAAVGAAEPACQCQPHAQGTTSRGVVDAAPRSPLIYVLNYEPLLDVTLYSTSPQNGNPRPVNGSHLGI